MGFPKDFMWGAASAAYQLEGAYNEDGKSMSIWDEYCNEGDYVRFGENGKVACDHYHRFKDDIAEMKKIGLKSYRFSFSWTRIIPEGTGKVNQKGIDFYSSLIDELIANDITPIATAFHWDYPLSLHKKGGWLNDESSEWFAEYVKVLAENFSDRIKYWITINEPQCFIGLGYQVGEHAPFYTLGTKDLTHMSHNVLLAHGKAVKMLRKYGKQELKIGFAPTGPCFLPENNSPEEIERARSLSFKVNDENFAFSNAWWADPVFFGKYPVKETMPDVKDGDMEIISQPLDFYGVNLYESHSAQTSKYKQGIAKTQLSWYITPELMYWASKFFYERYNLPVLVTENGVACHDWVHLDGKVHDPDRIDFIARYLKEFMKASEDGIEIIGYMYWSVMDNMEWAKGYDPRFGLIYVDYQSQQRIIKDSGYWYKKVIETNGEILKDM